MLKKIITKIADFVFGILVTVYIILEEVVWENIAEPIYTFLHGLKILQTVETFIGKLDRHVLLVLFLALFSQVELLGLFALKLIGTGKVIAGSALYAGKIPVAAFTFWLFRISKQKLITFTWFKLVYELIISTIARIKSSSIYLRVTARIIAVKVWFKFYLSNPWLFIHQLIETLKSSMILQKIRALFLNASNQASH